MMKQLEFESINSAQLHLLKEVLEKGQPVKTRDLETLELSPVFFSITNPRKRVTTLNGRNWKLAPAIGELSWHLAVSNELGFISNYLSGWKDFSEDKKRITGSCYGNRIFKKNNGENSRWQEVIELLKADKQSRRAVISLLDPDVNINNTALDISCTISLQFLIRNGRLDVIVNMRSNDIIWGLPYDFFFFSYLQELMAFELNLPVGTYYHIAASLHLYESHFKMAKKIISGKEDYFDFEMPPLKSLELDLFLAAELKIRNGEINSDYVNNLNIDRYWKELLEVLLHYNIIKHNKTPTDSIKINNPYAALV